MSRIQVSWMAAAACLVLVACGSSGSGGGGAAAGGTATAGAPPPVTTPPPAPATPWGPIGPSPPAVEAPIAVNGRTGTIYIASLGGGVLKSTNSGASFKAANEGLGSVSLASMAMAANDPNTVYVGSFNGGIFKTTDGAANWVVTGERTNITLTLAIDPFNANVVYAGYNGTPSIRKTTDGGATWVAASTGIPSTAIFALTVDPNDPRVVYAGSTGNGAFKSTDGGTTWQPLAIETTVYALHVDPLVPGTIYAGGNGGGVYVSRDGGASFTVAGIPGDGVVLAIARRGPLLYAGTASTGLWASSDDGRTWNRTSISGGLVLSLSVDSDGRVFAGTGRRGAFVAGGLVFTPLAEAQLQACLCQNVYSVSIDPSDRLHLKIATNDGGMIETRNGGSTWQDAGTSGMTARAPRQAVFDPRDPQRVYAGAFTGSGFFRSTDGGRSWSRRNFGPATLHTTGTAVDPADRAVYVATLQAGGIWKSTDLGETFTRVDVQVAGGPFLNLNGRGIGTDPGRPGVVFHAGGTGIWRSTNAGATWTRISTTGALTVTVDPTDSRVVYVGTLSAGVLKSTDGGTTFNPANVGLTELRTGRTGGVVLHRSNPQLLYVNTEGGGVFRSTDAGGSWSAVNGGLTELTVFGLAMDPTDPRTIYAGTPAGVFRTVTGGT